MLPSFPYTKYNATLEKLNSEIIESKNSLTEEERIVLLDLYCRDASRKEFPLTNKIYKNSEEFLENIVENVNKAKKYIQENNLVYAEFYEEYDCIVVCGYKYCSDEDLLIWWKKEKLRQEKQNAKELQAKVRSRTAAIKEVKRLKKKFKIK